MKLELKHLTPYLPYSLDMFVYDDIEELIGLDSLEIEIKTISGDYKINEFIKPILRPLSDLNQEVEIDGVNTIPIQKLGSRYSTITCMIYKNTIQLDVNDLSSINLLHYMITFEKLCKMHFDLFGLIDNGLAIDINTVK